MLHSGNNVHKICQNGGTEYGGGYVLVKQADMVGYREALPGLQETLAVYIYLQSTSLVPGDAWRRFFIVFLQVLRSWPFMSRRGSAAAAETLAAVEPGLPFDDSFSPPCLLLSAVGGLLLPFLLLTLPCLNGSVSKSPLP